MQKQLFHSQHFHVSSACKTLFNNILCYSIPEPTPSTMTALHQFGAEMLKLSRGLESFAPINEPSSINTDLIESSDILDEEPSKNNNHEQTSSTNQSSSKNNK